MQKSSGNHIQEELLDTVDIMELVQNTRQNAERLQTSETKDQYKDYLVLEVLQDLSEEKLFL